MRIGFLLPACSTLAALVLAAAVAAAEVTTYPAPAGEKLSKDYEIQADGKRVDVYTARTLDTPFAGKEWDYGGPYWFANFDTAGPVTVRITAKKSLRKVVVRPQSPAANLKIINAHTIELSLAGPRKTRASSRTASGDRCCCSSIRWRLSPLI